MSIIRAIQAELVNDSGVQSAVGQHTDGHYRVYRGRADQGDDTYINIWAIGSPDTHYPLDGSDTLRQMTVQIDAVGPTGKKTDEIRDAVRNALNQYKGTMGTGSDTADVRGCTLQNDPEEWVEPEQAGQEAPVKRAMDWMITYEDTAVSHLE